MMKRKLWTNDDLIVVFNLYCKIPFGRIHNRNPEIINLAKLIGRTPSSVSWKLANFSRLDPSLKDRGIQGAQHGSKAEESVWIQFYDNWEELSFESEKMISKLRGENINLINEEKKTHDVFETEKLLTTKTRINQKFFRTSVLSAYRASCCITGIKIPELLIASHIKPWAIDVENRVNPMNGLCLNVLHDKAFDRGLITISKDYRVRLSRIIKSQKNNKFIGENFIKYEDLEISLPDKFLPKVDLLDFHNKNIFQGA
jgi:putative restriction endonuclease